MRVAGSIFFTTFYIMSLNVYMVMLQCQPVHGVWVQVQFDDTGVKHGNGRELGERGGREGKGGWGEGGREGRKERC